MSIKIAVIDAYDSFVHIIFGYLRQLGHDVTVYRNDEPGLSDQILKNNFEMLVLGPGPGHPSESGYHQLIEHVGGKIPILGICLGHQALANYFGARLNYAKRLMHGKTSEIIHDHRGCFSSLTAPRFKAMRYHSIIVEDDRLPSCLEVTARSNIDNYVMGIRHISLPLEGVQFHPESVGTDQGRDIFTNFIDQYILKKEKQNEVA